MNTKIQTIHLANNDTNAIDVSFDILDDAGQPVKPLRSQFTASPELVAMLLSECQAHADGKVATVADATVRAGAIANALKTLDDAKTEQASVDRELSHKRAELKSLSETIPAKNKP